MFFILQMEYGGKYFRSPNGTCWPNENNNYIPALHEIA